MCRGEEPYRHLTRHIPRDVLLEASMDEQPTILAFPDSLDAIIDYAFPDALMVGGTRHSERAFTIYVLDLNYSYTRWLASLSLDGRWTLSPLDPR
jgi:hypothetical protein